MSMIKHILIIITLNLFITTFFSQSGDKFNYEIKWTPLQKSIIKKDRFTPVINKDYAAFDFQISKQQIDFCINRKFKKKWIAELGLGLSKKQMDWNVFEKYSLSNSNNYTSISSSSEYYFINVSLAIGYQIFKSTKIKLSAIPQYLLFSKSNFIPNTVNRGSINSNNNFRADYNEDNSNFRVGLNYDIQFNTKISNQFYLNYGINFTYLGGALFTYNLTGKPPVFNQNETILSVKISGYIPFVYLGIGYKINQK